jgi:hypothetical protein
MNNREGHLDSVVPKRWDNSSIVVHFVIDRSISRDASATMKPVPISADFVLTRGAFLSWMIVAIRCTRCNHSAQPEGPLDYVELLDRHREHLGSVIVDLLLSNLGRDDLSEIRMRLVPTETQVIALFFSVN